MTAQFKQIEQGPRGGSVVRMAGQVTSEINGVLVVYEHPSGHHEVIKLVRWEGLADGNGKAWTDVRAVVVKRAARGEDVRVHGLLVPGVDRYALAKITRTQLQFEDPAYGQRRTFTRRNGSEVGVSRGRRGLSGDALAACETYAAGREVVDVVAERKKLGQRNEVPSP